MNTFPSTAAPAAAYGGPSSWFQRTTAWLDAKGRGAWIAAMVLGFVFFWPVGLALVFYITATKRWSNPMFNSSCAARRHSRDWGHSHRAYQTSGNTAFDTYKTEMLKRLEDEQTAFESFMQRLRDAKDKSEFDAFMDDRAKAATAPATAGPVGQEAARTGEY
jgi:hypothetical protein